MGSAVTAAKKKPAKRRVKKTAVPAGETILVLRTCAADMTSRNGQFRWPTSGPVEAPDWNPKAICGQGLHGLLWGEGDGSLVSWDEDAKWLVVEVLAADVVDLAGKVKFPRGVVVCCGTALEATGYIAARSVNRAIVGGSATAGYRGTATAGDGGTATAGDGGTATAGDRGTATAGYGGEIRIRWYDPKTERYRVTVGYVGEDGVTAGIAYVVRAGKIVKAGDE